MNKEFQVHMPNKQGQDNAKEIAAAFDVCLNRLMELCPLGREMSLVRTKMEEACFFAQRAMSNNPNNCQVEQCLQ